MSCEISRASYHSLAPAMAVTLEGKESEEGQSREDKGRERVRVPRIICFSPGRLTRKRRGVPRNMTCQQDKMTQNKISSWIF